MRGTYAFGSFEILGAVDARIDERADQEDVGDAIEDGLAIDPIVRGLKFLDCHLVLSISRRSLSNCPLAKRKQHPHRDPPSGAITRQDDVFPLVPLIRAQMSEQFEARLDAGRTGRERGERPDGNDHAAFELVGEFLDERPVEVLGL